MESLLGAVVAGALQGLLEWLPVSSRGNVAVVMARFLGLDAQSALQGSILLHVGTALAALVYFRATVWRILLRGTPEDRAMFSYLLVSTAVTGIVGLPLYLLLEATVAQGEALLALTGIALLLTGLLQKMGRRSLKNDPRLGLLEAAVMGCVQGLSAIPGLSRSGLTTSALLMRGLDAEEALRVSFLMSIPASLAASAGISLIRGVDASPVFLAAGILTSFIVGYLAMGTLLRLTRRIDFWKVCLLLGGLILVSTLPSLLRLI